MKKKPAVLFVLFFAFAAFAVFGATEHRVSDIVPGTPPGQRNGPALGTDGNGYLAVWRDTRDGSESLIAARIGSSGELLDPTGIVLSEESGGPADVVWTGERYLVFFPVNRTILMASVDRDGNASQPTQILENAADIAVATNGSRIVIAYEGDRGSVAVPPRPYVAVLNLDGAVVGSGPVGMDRTEKLAMSVLTDDGGFVVSWNDEEMHRFTLKAVRLGSGGDNLTADPFILGTPATKEAFLYANGDAFVAASEDVSWGVSADLAAATTPKARPAGMVFKLEGRAAIVRQIEGKVAVTSIDANGYAGAATEVTAAVPDDSHRAGAFSAMQNDGRLFVAWTTSHTRSGLPISQLLGTVADARSLTPVTQTFEVTVSAPPQFAPAIAAGATESLVAWQEPEGVYAARIDDAGRRLDGRGIRLSESGIIGAPRVAFHEGRYAVAFLDGGELVIRFITPNGTLLPDRVRVAAGVWQPRVDIASGGGTLLVAWSTGVEVLATRVHPSLTVDPPVTVSADVDMAAVDPAVGWNGTHFLVAWVGTYEFDRTIVRPQIHTRRVTPALGLAGASTTTESSRTSYPSIASDGRDWFVAWSNDFLDTEIHLMRVPASGALAGDSVVAEGRAPELAWNGKTLLLAYRPANGALTVTPIGPGTAETIPGRTPPGDAFTFDQTGIAWHNGRWIAVYPRFGDTAEGFVPRVFAAISGGRSKGRVVR